MTMKMDLADFDSERPRLTTLAIRILGSKADADDVLQDAWLRFSRAEAVDDLPAWLTTVVTRLCLDQLRRRGVRSEFEATAPVDPDQRNPEEDALLADITGDALQVVVDALAPAERAAFVLHDVFGYHFDEVGAIMGRSTTAVRQLASRARRKVRGVDESAASKSTRAEHQQVVSAFLTAARGGDLKALLSLLAPDAIMRADPAGQALGSEEAYRGADAIAARFNGTRGAVSVTIDDDPGAAWIQAGSTRVAFAFHLDEAGLVHEIELIADPDVLTTMTIVRQRTRSGH
jgi:RNA polymerase sigma factor (sigma-70 family)